MCAIDFGLSTFFRDNQVFVDLVGSPYYVAPEVLRRRYGREADIWSCGVILYILLSGVPPFWAQTEQGIFDAILQSSLDLDSDPWPKISSEAKELISGMLQSDPSKRMTAAQVLKHPWVADPNVAPKTKLDNTVFKRFKNFAGMTKFKKMGLMAMAKTMTSDEVAGLKELFKSFDTDGSGTIDPKELRAAMQSLGFEAKNQTIFQMISDLDKNKSGSIDFEEFLDMMTARMSDKDTREDIAKVFRLFDDDTSGSITLRNLRRVAKELGDTMTDEEL